MKNSFRIPLVALFTFGVFMAGCKSNSTGPGPTGSTTTVTRPGVGSTFVFHYQEFDTLGHSIASKEEWDTDVVIASGISFEGKTNVVKFRFGNSITPNTGVAYLNYEANGDISSYIDAEGKAGYRSGWETIPLGSKTTTSFVSYDSSYVVANGSLYHGVQTDIYNYTGEQTVPEAGTTLDALAFSFEPVQQDGYKDYSSSAWWAPSIGWAIKETDSFTLPDANGAKSEEWDLVSYSLK